MLLGFLGLDPRVPALIHRFKEIWISLDKLASLWMLIQSARLGERGSIPERSQRPSMYSQTTLLFFFSESEIPPQIPQHLCVKICIYTRGKLHPDLCILKENAWTHTWASISSGLLKAGIASFRRAWACLHTTGYFRGDSLQKSHLKTRKNGILK